MDDAAEGKGSAEDAARTASSSSSRRSVRGSPLPAKEAASTLAQGEHGRSDRPLSLRKVCSSLCSFRICCLHSLSSVPLSVALTRNEPRLKERCRTATKKVVRDLFFLVAVFVCVRDVYGRSVDDRRVNPRKIMATRSRGRTPNLGEVFFFFFAFHG